MTSQDSQPTAAAAAAVQPPSIKLRMPDQANAALDKRDRATRETYWDNTAGDDILMRILGDAVIGVMARTPTPAQLKLLFMLMPNKLFGRGIARQWHADVSWSVVQWLDGDPATQQALLDIH